MHVNDTACLRIAGRSLAMPTTQHATQTRWASVRFGLLVTLLVALAGRTALLCARYFLKDSATKSFHVETGALWFVVVAVVLAVTRTTSSPESDSVRPRGVVGEYALWGVGQHSPVLAGANRRVLVR